MMIGKGLNLTKFKPLKPKKKSSFNQLKLISNYLNIGFYLIIPLLASLYIGIKLDNCFKTKPLFTLVFIAIGLVVDFYELRKLIKES